MLYMTKQSPIIFNNISIKKERERELRNKCIRNKIIFCLTQIHSFRVN